MYSNILCSARLQDIVCTLVGILAGTLAPSSELYTDKVENHGTFKC